MLIHQYSVLGKILFGKGSIEEIKKEIDSKEILFIVTDRGISNSGILSRVIEVLNESKISYYVFNQVESDPSMEIVEKAAEEYKQKNCTLIMGLGGGSSIDVAKSVGILATQGGNLEEYAYGRPIIGELPRIIAIPTTAGTGSEVTSVAIISDLKNKIKMAIRDPKITPRIAILDPSLLSTIPKKVAAETAADALSHAIESYVGLRSFPITDAMALYAIQLISNNIFNFISYPENIESAGNMLLASCMAGISFNNAGLGLVHGLAHPLGAYFHISHGLACGICLPSVMEFNEPACQDKFFMIAKILGKKVNGLKKDIATKEAVSAIKDLLKNVGIPSRLSEIGIKFKLDQKMIEDTLSMAPTKNNPRSVTREDITKIFESIA